MKRQKLSRRDVLKGSTAFALGTVFASAARAEAPPAQAITPQLIEAAKKEAKVVLYSAMDLPVGEKLGKAFEAHYPGIAVQIERSGSERLFQRIDQEFASGIRACDVVNSADASHFIPWKKNGWLALFVSEDIAKHFPPEYRDPDGMSATTRIYLSSIAYSKQRVMQVQSSTDPPKKLALGERAVMADGNEYNIVLLKEAGQPVEPIYPAEGTPTISGPTGIFASAPHPNAARLFQAWLHTRETQQFFIDFTAQYSVHAQVQSKPGRRKISDTKLMKEDAAGVEKMAEEIKTRYARLFRV